MCLEHIPIVEHARAKYWRNSAPTFFMSMYVLTQYTTTQKREMRPFMYSRKGRILWDLWCR